MRTLAPYIGAVVLGIHTVSPAASKPNSLPRLRYSDDYTRYKCELKKLSGGGLEDLFGIDGNLRGQAKEELSKRFDAEERLKEQFQSAVSNPYPPALEGYRPKSFELVEFLWNAGPCSGARYQDAPKVPATFRCRLDKTILKDSETGKQFFASAALASDRGLLSSSRIRP
jgi:hypothetical protein